MYRSPYSTQDDTHDHLRNLIDQRNARADLHGRFSSAVSEYSDTPSVYSRGYLSPQHLENGEHFGGYPYSTPVPEAQSSRTPRHDQQASMLDLDDDSRNSYAPSEVYEPSNDTYEDVGDGEESVARMSYLGPKMRFHSRAPWEEDTLMEEDEPEEQRHFPAGFPFPRKNTPKSGTSGSSSPRPSFTAPSASRPSVESSHSQLSAKQSFETISSQMSYPRGALYTLAQESMSSNSLARPPPPLPAQKERLLSKLSFSRLRHGVETTPMSSSSNSPLASPAIIRNQATHSYATPSAVTPASLRSISPDSFEYSSPAKSTAIHPYAHPDVFASFSSESHVNESGPQPSKSSAPLRNSNLTVTETYSSDSMAQSNSRSTLTSDTSLSSVSVMSRLRLPSLGQKGASSPTHPVIGTPKPLIPGAPLSSSPPNAPQMAGWAERSPAAAPFSLISLEEARAQRMRSLTASGATPSDLGAPFPGEGSESAGIEPPPSAFAHLTSRARGRSISAGSKAKNTFQNKAPPLKMERRDSEPVIAEYQGFAGPPPGKTLKNKKSGFMRLFNKEKEGQESPPPVPSLPETVSQTQLPTLRTVKPVQRVPVPSLSPSLQIFDTSTGTSFEPIDAPLPSKSPKRHPPPALSIHAIAHGAQSRASTTDRHPRTYLERPFLDQFPQSAPANVSEFPVLKLRPVSTLFSAHFGEHIVPGGGTPRSSEDTDLSTPRSPSPSALISPITPISMSRPSQDHAGIAYAHTPDDTSIVRSLQGQMVSQKKEWQSRIWELESQVRDLKAELEDAKSRNVNKDETCERCGRGAKRPTQAHSGLSVVNRPRARTGTTSRFANPHP